MRRTACIENERRGERVVAKTSGWPAARQPSRVCTPRRAAAVATLPAAETGDRQVDWTSRVVMTASGEFSTAAATSLLRDLKCQLSAKSDVSECRLSRMGDDNDEHNSRRFSTARLRFVVSGSHRRTRIADDDTN